MQELHYSLLLDCDDANALVNPGKADICNGVDDNCSAQIDDGCALLEVVYITIDGADEIEDNSTTQFTCNAHYNDGSASDVTANVAWTGDSCYAGVDDDGYLVAGFIPYYQGITIAAVFEGKEASRVVWVTKNSPSLDIRHVETNGLCSRDSLPSCTPCSGTIQSAINQASEGRQTEIKVSGGIYPENLLFSREKNIKLAGVADLFYPSASPSAEVHGSLTIRKGTVIVEGIILGPP